jgi:hypothetical protein
MKIVDCFMFYNEFELLGLRLKEGYDYVEKFIITEARITHRGEGLEELAAKALQGGQNGILRLGTKVNE